MSDLNSNELRAAEVVGTPTREWGGSPVPALNAG